MKYRIPIGTFAVGLVAGFGFSFGMVSQIASPARPSITLRGLAKLTGSNHWFSRVIHETCGVKILPFVRGNISHLAIKKTVIEAAQEVSREMSRVDSPARLKSRINEVSSLFEDALREKIDGHPDFSCDYPKTKSGEGQRSGYPDLRIEHLPSATVAYLDPKLFKDTSLKSSFRTFYFEPGGETSKVTEDALHLLIGFPHDGNTGEWTFGEAKLIDLSSLEITLKTEFSASNREVYQTVMETTAR